jgi:hypothetical protein
MPQQVIKNSIYRAFIYLTKVKHFFAIKKIFLPLRCILTHNLTVPVNNFLIKASDDPCAAREKALSLFSTAQHSTAQHSTAQHSTAQHSTLILI